MIDRAGRGHHDVRRAIVAGQIVAQPAAIERAHRLGRAEDRAAERLIGKGDDLQVLENKIVGRVGDSADLLDDDVLLAQHFIAREGRLGENVGEHVERERHVGLEHPRVIGGAFDTGRRIEIAADGFDFFGDLPRARRRVPLNAICSRKCDIPCSSRRSSRLPEAIHTPSEAVSRCGIASVTTLMPDFKVVTSTLMLPLLPARRGLSAGRTARPPTVPPAAR